MDLYLISFASVFVSNSILTDFSVVLKKITMGWNYYADGSLSHCRQNADVTGCCLVLCEIGITLYHSALS